MRLRDDVVERALALAEGTTRAPFVAIGPALDEPEATFKPGLFFASVLPALRAGVFNTDVDLVPLEIAVAGFEEGAFFPAVFDIVPVASAGFVHECASHQSATS